MPALTPADSTRMRSPTRWRRIAAAMGLRTALSAHANRTDRGPPPSPDTCSPLPVQGRDEREEAPGGIEIDLDLSLEPLDEHAAALVMQPAPADVDRL